MTPKEAVYHLYVLDLVELANLDDTSDGHATSTQFFGTKMRINIL